MVEGPVPGREARGDVRAHALQRSVDLDGHAAARPAGRDMIFRSTSSMLQKAVIWNTQLIRTNTIAQQLEPPVNVYVVSRIFDKVHGTHFCREAPHLPQETDLDSECVSVLMRWVSLQPYVTYCGKGTPILP